MCRSTFQTQTAAAIGGGATAPESAAAADEERVHSLTAMLLQRQSMLEAAVAEKNSMALQLEREKVRRRRRTTESE